MKKIDNIWKYILVSTFILCLGACSNEIDDVPSVENTEVSRAALVERTIELTEPGTLQTKVEAAMGDEDVSTLQKLTLSGPFTGVDVQYWKTSLTNLVEFDLTNAVPKGVDGKNTYIDSYGNEVWLNENSVSQGMFSYMTKLEKLSFPMCATWVGWAACEGCTSLIEVLIPESVTSFDSGIFTDCISLKTVSLPSRITSIGSNFFGGCISLESIVIPERVTDIYWGAFEGCRSLKEISIPDAVTNIEGGVFRNCISLEKIKWPSTITVVKDNAFSGCKSLNNFTPFLNVTEIQQYAFGGCAFESLDLSNVNVLEGGFSDCVNLKSVKLSDNVKKFGRQLFSWCSSLEEINIPSKLEYIDDYALTGTAIKQLTIPETVTYIGHDAFRDMPIKMLTIPSSVTQVGSNCFDGCRNLRALVWNSTAEVRDIWNIDHHPYLYLAYANTPIGPNWKNVIINGEAESITLCEGGWREDPSRSFYIPIAFKAKKISFERQFDDWRWTYPGRASGWQTIVLPFTPTKIEHETKGVIAPFNSGIDGAKPFWLRELTSEGFKDVTTMKPNVPYIIAMPNNDQYLEEYRLYGKIIFSAENVELGVTPETLVPSEGPDYVLQPTYQYVQAGPQVYALNYNYGVDGYECGGVFARSSSDVYCFEAYVVSNGRSARSVFEMGTRSSATRSPYTPNKTGVPQIGDM